MIEMVRRFLRQRLGSPAMVIALGILAVLTAMQAAVSNAEQAFGTGFLAILLIGAGAVSKDASGGALQMILVRPIRRTSYLFGRYLGILLVFVIYVAAAGALTPLIARIVPYPSPGRSASDVSFADLGRGAASAFLNCLLFAAIILFFSTFLRGYADVLALILLQIVLGLLPQIPQAWVKRAAPVLRDNVLPYVDWREVLRASGAMGEPVGRWALAVTVFLVLAALVFSRREFSYGHD